MFTEIRQSLVGLVRRYLAIITIFAIHFTTLADEHSKSDFSWNKIS